MSRSHSKLPILLAANALALLTLGCASPGPPQPPSLQLPAPATGLAAQRSGDHVILTWNTPTTTTDKQTIRKPITAVICREVVAHPRPGPAIPRPASTPAPCTPVERLPVAPGEYRHVQTLPPALLVDPPQLLIYRIQLQNPQGRFAPPPPQVYAASGSAPPPTGSIHVRPGRDGAVIEWTPLPTTTSMQLHRTLIADVKGPITPPATKKPKTRSPLGGGPAPSTPPNQATLRSPDSPTDPGGLLDPTVKPLDTYTYTAQRIRTVTLGRHTLDLFGEPSAPVTLTNRDTFPPHAPTGLASVAGGGFNSPPSIDLSWEPNTEHDLLGYNLYRAETPAGPFRKLNATPLPGPSYRDLAVEPGHPYLYRVTSIDETGNESSPSATIKDTLPAR
ncbi:fibronectin type III domain-containing protein [Granulicella tundricola]|uniref:Fibronectin type III domain protein n=1 Tax=Granulicella tundricola (strain ATCC BAA-1859 / DSM 23138 / MP5ACTX9) TaxID=1198114 RepID=E8WXG2_GRATM|nr:fibronectin type III domain-containing protein [Granulicella tundricola]ADW67495.1 Fibronectin type III domain protein [Granulicella tundricola MP5ACTX9]